MRRITVGYNSGEIDVWKCGSAIYGHGSQNAVLSNARLDGTTETDDSIESVLLPLANVRTLTEDAW